MRTLSFFSLIFICQLTFSQNRNPNELFNKAYQSITNREYEKSIELLTIAIELDSLGNCGTGIDGKAQNELGYAYMLTQDYELSRNYYDQSIKLNPKNPQPRINKVTSYILEKDFAKALIELDVFIKELPGYPIAYWQKGNILENQGKIDEALKEYRKARAFNRQLKILPESLVRSIEEKLQSD